MDFKDNIKWKESIKANIASLGEHLLLLVFAPGKERERKLASYQGDFSHVYSFSK